MGKGRELHGDLGVVRKVFLVGRNERMVLIA